jgi:predicted S18 family serine protease
MDIDIASLVDLMMKRRLAFEYERYYSMASFCFSSNMILQDYIKRSLTETETNSEVSKLNKSLEYFREQLSRKEIKSMTDLQTYIIVKERLYETEDYLRYISELNIKAENDKNISLKEKGIVLNNTRSALSFATERFYSASVWADFFNIDKGYFEIDDYSLEKSCLNKIFEAQERVEYMKLYFPEFVASAQKSIDVANSEYERKDYSYCLFKASLAKAQIDAMISSFSITKENIDENLLDKKMITSKLIKKQQDKGVFPILAFSYYEYAQSLSQSDKISDKTSAFLYYDYAIELSNLDLYFKKKTGRFEIVLDPRIYSLISEIVINVIFFITGIVIGMYIVISNTKNLKEKYKKIEKKRNTKKKNKK